MLFILTKVVFEEKRQNWVELSFIRSFSIRLWMACIKRFEFFVLAVMLLFKNVRNSFTI
jgi:hypothetical protein